MFPDLLDLLHVGRFLVAGRDQVYQVQKGQNYQGYVEYVVLVESGVESEVVNLQPEYHVDLGVVGVGGEGTYAQLDHPHRCDQHQNHVEKKTVHPSLVFFHWMETTATRNSDTKFDSPLLHAPKNVQAEIGEDASSQKTCVSVVQADEKFVHEGNQRSSQGAFGNITKYAE